MTSNTEPRQLTHLTEDGRARMVDVGGKPETERTAVAEGRLRMARATFEALQAGQTPKGDPLLVAQIAGIQAAKGTSNLIPLCHPLPLTQVDVQVELDATIPGVRVRSTARVRGRTGVEMEALTATSIALLTVWDMVKALDMGLVMEDVRLLEKEGGRSGAWRAGASPDRPQEDAP
ncbi:MAG TPA: cyclic pyranopterin monophosphate synthase MoaC [Longimicrobiales bacterium]|nr:cyclic pyranopterin monophosphate synthase MoaC [Longimicrobiales bacterium]